MANTAKTTKKACAKKCKKTSATKTVAAEYRPREVRIPEGYEPIGMWGYFGYELLFTIPLIGWIFCICFAFMARNHNLRNFARSQFCYLIIYVVVVCLLAGFGVFSNIAETFGII